MSEREAPDRPVFTVEPWCVREPELRLDRLAQTEAVFALSNGHLGMRGNLDEGEPHGMPGTYLNSFYEQRPLPQAELAYGTPESGQTVINVTNGKVIRLLVDDEPFDVRYGRVHHHERVLDMRAGTLTRTVEWTSPTDRRVKITSVRMVSLPQRAVAAILYEVEPVGAAVRVVAQSELVANEALPDGQRDPRASATLEDPLVGEEHVANGTKVLLLHRTRKSGLRMAAGMAHHIDGPESMAVETESAPDVGRLTVATRLEPGQKLRIVKYIAYGWSSQRSRPALHDQVVGALAGARQTGWDGLLREQRAYLDDFWCGADIEVEGDAEIQQAVRFALFHVLQAGARAERRMIPAKGLTGPGYDGHTFWDTEMFVLPVLTYTHPDAAADALAWRHMTLPLALERAAQLGLRGAAFPWRTIRGHECSGYWPAGTAAFHVNAAIADAVVRYVDATRDERFEREIGLEILVHTARLWRSLGHHDVGGVFRIDGVTGPDEYSAVVDNNVYTNLMARRNLEAAADTAMRHPDLADRLGVDSEEAASWRDAAAAMVVPYDDRLGVHPQSENFTNHARWDFAATKPDHYPLLLNYPYFDLYRKQVVKQADLVLALHACGDAFTIDQKTRDFEYYEGLTVRDSSLSAQTQAVVAAEVGHLELAHDYLGETALVDLHDLNRNTRDGLHIASMAGAWSGIVAGFGGMRAGDGRLRFAPRLPGGISHVSFRLRYRGNRLKVSVTAEEARYELLDGPGLKLWHHDEPVTLADEPVELPIPPLQPRPAPSQPPGREPAPRRIDPHARTL
ncbi:glycoside hydrolase family 65 protein [Spirillospora albida]|uniref:glycoside hydrolase family 65 protein n=1 Tax=Spirillospora albida TaxID=58123 RepID=UPI0004BF25F7|nr:glycosyl hydrolase family 65 protein [Spirillospora albida]